VSAVGRATSGSVTARNLSLLQAISATATNAMARRPCVTLAPPEEFLCIEVSLGCQGLEGNVDARGPVARRRKRQEIGGREIRARAGVDFRVEPREIGPRLQVPAGDREAH